MRNIAKFLVSGTLADGGGGEGWRWGIVDSGNGPHVHEKEHALSFNKRVCL